MYGRYSNQRKVRARVEQPRYSLRARQPDKIDLTVPVPSSPEKTQLVVEGILYAKTVTLFSNNEGRVVVDSRLMIVPKGITEEQLRSQVAKLDAEKDVYFHNFGEDQMDPMTVTMTTSNNVIFLRRLMEMSLDGEGEGYCSTRTEDISPVKFGPDVGRLHLEDVIRVKRSATSISWSEKFILSFGDEPNDSHREMKSVIRCSLESKEPHYIRESATLSGKTLIVGREIYLDKENREADFMHRNTRSYTIRPSFVAAPTPVTPRKPPRPLVSAQRLLQLKAVNKKNEAPQSREQQERKHLSTLETVPQEFLPIECPIDVHAAHILTMKNVGLKPVAWRVKSRPEELFTADPKDGVIKPGTTTKLTLKFGEGSDILSQTDSVDVEWTDIDQVISAADTQKIVIPVVYLN